MNDKIVSENAQFEDDDLLELEDFDVTKTFSSGSLIAEKSSEIISLETFADEDKETLVEKESESEEFESEKEGKPEQEPEVEQSPTFKSLANPKLPERNFENRAYLQMQSPDRIFFYWSTQANSFETLYKVLGNRAGNYEIAVKIVNLTAAREQIMPADTTGSAWFDVEPNSDYRAEIGFYAFNRPFIRLFFSNTVRTPRFAPSPNTDYQPYFAVTPTQFADILDSSGYTQDAFDVFLTGDSPENADEATRLAYSKIAGEEDTNFEEVNLAELRLVLFALASGVTLVQLKEEVSPKLFEFVRTLSANRGESVSEEKVIGALEEFFGFSPFFEESEEILSPTVFGSSAINFPKNLRRKVRFSPDKLKSFDKRLSPLSSLFLV